jgi:hypothetical protein
MNPGIHAAVIAAQKKQQEEEEKMTQYNAEDLNGWEFKIVRSTFGRFNNPEVVRRLISEEAQNGWEMVEKFDEYRIRFKRRTDRRGLRSDGALDPYRTNYGMSKAIPPLVAIVSALLLAGVVLLFDSKGHEVRSAFPFIILGVIALLGVVTVIIRRK